MADLGTTIGSFLSDRYSIERELGRGGMATVFLARDLKHGRPVALKVLRPEFGDTLGPERFLREIQVAARLTHPHILAVHDSGRVEGLLYYVMPYIEGESLRDRLLREHRLKTDEVVRIGCEVADALEYAHARGVIHRDIKPENILLGAGHAIVADFGIARAMTAALGAELTGTGAAVGTPMYMSPEQIAGDPDLDGRSDIYSLGCVIFEALTGSPPFSGRTAQAILVRRLTETPPLLRSLDPGTPLGLEATVARALSTEAADRYPTAAEFAAALRLGAAGSLVTPPEGVAKAAPGHRIVDESIAVLPFVNLSSDPETDYFSDGMTEEIISALSQVPGLRVAARTSSFTFKGRTADVREIAERLRVRTLLEGSVRKAGDRVRITAQLINAADGFHLWSQTYDRTLADVFAVQDELARAIARTLTQTVPDAPSGPLVEPQTENLEAYTLYLRGRHAWATASLEGYQTAAACYEQAIALDPEYAQAYAWLSYAYAMLGFDEFGVLPVQEAMPKARAAAVRAVELDATLGDAHFARAVVATLYEWDWPLAQAEFERAVGLAATTALARPWYALFLCAMGRTDQGLQVSLHARLMDPLSPVVQVVVGRCLHYARRYDEAVRVFRTHLEVNPGSLHGCLALARTYLAQGSFAEALAEVERGTTALGRIPLLLVFAGHAHAALGDHDQALRLLAELRELGTRRYVPVLYEAHILIALGETDEAFRLYELAYQQRSGYLLLLRAEPTLFDPLRSDPRFVSLLKRLRLDF